MRMFNQVVFFLEDESSVNEMEVVLRTLAQAFPDEPSISHARVASGRHLPMPMVTIPVPVDRADAITERLDLEMSKKGLKMADKAARDRASARRKEQG